jgi:hypothetical protein
MINDTLAKIEAQLSGSQSLSPEKRAELLALLQRLREEVAQFSESNDDQAQSIATFAQASTHEATRRERNPELLRHSLDGLSATVEGIEQSHPKLVQVVNSICQTLSNLGI